MVGSRTATAITGLLVSAAITVALWWYLDTLAVFLFLPIVPWLLRDRNPDDGTDAAGLRTCPRCGYRSADSRDEFCPRDGSRLE